MSRPADDPPGEGGRRRDATLGDGPKLSNLRQRNPNGLPPGGQPETAPPQRKSTWGPPPRRLGRDQRRPPLRGPWGKR
jgi:hypothetical protein